MPRMGRVVVPNYPHHFVQRGHNRRVVFADATDFEYYLKTLAMFKAEYAIQVYGLCLMTNRVHLVLQSGERVAGLCGEVARLARLQLIHCSPSRATSAHGMRLPTCRAYPGPESTHPRMRVNPRRPQRLTR